MAVQQNDYSITLINISCDKENIISIKKKEKSSQKKNSIVFFDFLYVSNANFDFVVGENLGIHLYKLDEDKMTSKEIKVVNVHIDYCWFEVRNKERREGGREECSILIF